MKILSKMSKTFLISFSLVLSHNILCNIYSQCFEDSHSKKILLFKSNGDAQYLFPFFLFFLSKGNPQRLSSKEVEWILKTGYYALSDAKSWNSYCNCCLTSLKLSQIWLGEGEQSPGMEQEQGKRKKPIQEFPLDSVWDGTKVNSLPISLSVYCWFHLPFQG